MWAQNNAYSRGQIVEYNSRMYQALSEFGNLSKPDDLCSRLLYEIFNFPSRTFMIIHVLYGLQVLFYTFYALYQKRGLLIFLGQIAASFVMMWGSFQFAKGSNVRNYAFTN